MRSLRVARPLVLGFVLAVGGACTTTVPSPSSTPGTDPFDRVVVIGRHLEPTPPAAVDTLEQEVGFALPSGYRDFITRFGAGDYADLFRVYTPDLIRERLDEDRKRWADFWFFPDDDDLLSQRDMADAVPIADTFDGDEFVVHPKRGDVVFVMRRDQDRIDVLPADLRTLAGWGGRDEPFVFQPWSHQGRFEAATGRFQLDDQALVDRLERQWGADGVLVSYRDRQPDSWAVVAFVPASGLRIQVAADDGRRRAGGQADLWVMVHGDEEAIPEARRFFAALSQDGLMDPLVDR